MITTKKNKNITKSLNKYVKNNLKIIKTCELKKCSKKIMKYMKNLNKQIKNKKNVVFIYEIQTLQDVYYYCITTT